MSSLKVHNLVRALNGPSLPGGFTFLDGEKIVIWKTKLLDESIIGVPARIALKFDKGIVIICNLNEKMTNC